MKKRVTEKWVFLVMAVFGMCANAFAADNLSDSEKILRLTSEAMKEAVWYMPAEVAEIVKKDDKKYFIVSIQNRQEYDAGHVPGSVLVSVDFNEPEKMAKQFPQDKKIIIVSSNGQEACKVSLLLRQLGYDSGILLLGMNSYNRLYAGSGAYTGDIGGELSTSPLEPEAKESVSSYSDKSARELVIEKTAEYAAANRPFEVTAYDLVKLDDAVLISMQKAEDYAKDHIPGTINIPGADFLNGDKRLLQLPKGKKIIVTCYLGHYSSMGAMLLNQMGYEAYSLRWGASGWNIKLTEDISSMLTAGMGLGVEKQTH